MKKKLPGLRKAPKRPAPRRPLRILLTWKLIETGFFAPLFVGALVLFSSWNHRYWQGWLFAILNMLAVWLGIYLTRDKPPQSRGRTRTRSALGIWAPWDRGLVMGLLLVLIIGSSIDAGHVHVSPPLGFLVYAAGLLIFLSGHGLTLWARRVNTELARPADLPVRPGLKVCTEGPYGFIRHPGYAGMILYILATPVVLGSLWGLVPAALCGGLIAARIVLEDRALIAGWKAYAGYARKVRFRLIPNVW